MAMKKKKLMFWTYILPELLLVIGGINWGLVGLFDFNLVAAIFGSGSFVSSLVYVLVGISAFFVGYDWVKKVVKM